MAAPAKYVSVVNSLTDPNASFGGGLSEAFMWQIFNVEPLATTASVESAVSSTANGIIIAPYKYFGLWAKAASPGTATFDIKIQQSFNDTAANYVQPATFGLVGSVANTTAVVLPVSPVPMPYFRIQITGTGSNDAGTTVTLYFWAMR